MRWRFPPCRGPTGGLDRGSLEQGGDCLRFEGSRRSTHERGRGGSTACEASEGPYRGAGPWAKRDLGFPYLKWLWAPEFRKDLAQVPNHVLRVLRVLYPWVREPHSYGTRQ